jgi:hypothetical protein
MQAVLERIELLPPVGVEDDQLAVEHVAALGESNLGEVAAQRLAASRLHVDVLAVDVDDRAEPVVLRLVCPALALRQDRARQGELGLDRGLQGQRHVAIVSGRQRA